MVQKNLLTNSEGQQLLNESRVDGILSIIGYSSKEFLKWWYVKMIVWHLQMLGRVSTIFDDYMSISLLLRNFFLPWHRDYSFIGYTFGILIKLLFLPLATIAYLFVCLGYILLILVWILLPPVTLFFIIRSIFTL